MNYAIRIQGLQEIKKACRDLDRELDDKVSTGALKETHIKVAGKVIDWAVPNMPSISGKFVGSWKSAKQARGAVVKSTLIYAGVNEFGGRIPNPYHHGSHLHKPKAPNESYFIYPAVRTHENAIVKLYEHELQRLIDSKFGR